MDERIEIVNNMNYLSPYRYISGRIIEYDLRSANINALKHNNFITDEDYIFLKNLPKQQREIEIGLRIKQNPKIYTEIQKGIKYAKKQLVTNNDIDSESIIRVANDAIYINSSKDLIYTKFGDYLEFVPKSISNIFINLNKTILLLSFDEFGQIHVDVKGINETLSNLHENYIMNGIVTTVVLLERSGVAEALSYLSELCSHYVRLELPVGWYREFNSFSTYRIKNIFGPYNPLNNETLGAESVGEEAKYSLDINYNYSILRELWSILLELYEIRVH